MPEETAKMIERWLTEFGQAMKKIGEVLEDHERRLKALEEWRKSH